MTRDFLTASAILVLAGGANAQSLAERLAKLEPKAEPKVEHRFPSPFKPEPEKKVEAFKPFVPPPPSGLWEPDLTRGSELLKGMKGLKQPGPFDPDPNPFGKRPVWTVPQPETVKPMDATKFPAERAVVNGWKKDFPYLGDDFEVRGTGTPNPTACSTKAGTDKAIPGTYNCIAHTAGIKNVWVNPYQKGEGWDLYYNPLGYQRVAGTDTTAVKGMQKVAVYATRLPDGKLKQYTHAAIQEADGTWTSKLGSGPLIRHRTAESVGGGTYGEVVRVYTRTQPK